jgi:glucokinase
VSGDPLLIGDLGGTHARFSLIGAKGGVLEEPLTVENRGYPSAEEAIASYLERVGVQRPGAICLAVAGPVTDQEVQFLNIDWNLDAQALGNRFHCPSVRLLNDFEAAAYGVPMLREDDVVAISAPVSSRGGLPDFSQEPITIGIVGPGTGLGVGGLVSLAGHRHALSAEGGHTGFAPETPLQMDVLRLLQQRFDRVSDERLLSGPGIENIYWALHQVHGLSPANRSAAEIFDRAHSDEDDVAIETVRLFYECLGQVAGNLALTLGAWDGIYIAGGIARRQAGRFDAPGFRSGFENKGRYCHIMEHVPTWLITHAHPGLLGAKYLALRAAGA